MGILPIVFWGLIIAALAVPELTEISFAALWLMCAVVSIWLWGLMQK